MTLRLVPTPKPHTWTKAETKAWTSAQKDEQELREAEDLEKRKEEADRWAVGVTVVVAVWLWLVTR